MHMPGTASPGPQPPPDPAHAHAVWTVNGKAMIHDGNKHDHSRIVPLLTGRSIGAESGARVVETGIKVIDVMCPLTAGGSVAIAGEPWTGITVLSEELVRRLSGGSDRVSLFTLIPHWPDRPADWSLTEGLKKDGYSEGTVGAVQTSLSKRLSSGMQFQASLGSTGPFIGLFGTVYGIMNSFIGIVKTQTTNLASVAPGIAEALLATGIGLFAAIPAVVAYNYFQTRISAFGGRSEGFVAELMNAISRQLDKGA